MVPDLTDHYPEADQSLYKDLKVPMYMMRDEEKNHRKSACFPQILSSSCMSGLTLDDSWSVDLLEEEPPTHLRGPALPLRGRRSLVLRGDEEQDKLSMNRFADVSQHQPSLCSPPTRRPSCDSSILSSDSSTAMLSLDLTSAYKSFNDSSVISVETEILEQDPVPNPTPPNHKSLPLRTHSRGNKIHPNKLSRRLTPTLEVPEEQDQSNWGGQDNLDEMPSNHTAVESTATTAPLRDHGRATRNNKAPRTPPRQKFSRDSITLESACIKATLGNHHWGVKSSLTLDSALFDESTLELAEPEEDCPSKGTSWAVGSSLSLATFEDSLSIIKSAANHDPVQQSSREEMPQNQGIANNPGLLCQEMNRLRFSSHNDGTSRHDNAFGSEHRTIPCTFSSISPCTKPIRTQSHSKARSNEDPSAADLS